MRKIPSKKRATRALKPRSNVDPSRVALAAMDRIRTMLVQSGYEDRLGAPLGQDDLAVLAGLVGVELPASYVAAMRVASRIGEPEVLLAAPDMAREADAIVAASGEEAKRYAPFCRAHDRVYCFDTGVARRPSPRLAGELAVVMWEGGEVSPAAAHFGEWLDMIADAREESLESAAQMPARLKRLLYELGFRFEYPVVGRLETGDVPAVCELLGAELARTVRGDVDRLFDSSGKASMTLNVDEFTLAVSLRTGIYVFEAEDVFRWLRHFRDENFFGDAAGERAPTHEDAVRDLRRAPPEPPLVLRGVMPVPSLAASRHVFRAASGVSARDFWVLGRTASTHERAKSLVLHVVDDEVAGTHTVDEPLHALHAEPDGSLWGLTQTHAIRFAGHEPRAFSLKRPGPGRAWWYGIGGAAGRVLVWGNGALLEFDGRGFSPFEPDAKLDDSESVVAVCATGLRVSMLVCGDRMGAVARFDAVRWLPITEEQVIEGALTDLDVWRGTAYVLDREGSVFKVDGGGPRQVSLPLRHQALLTESGGRRPLSEVRATDRGLLLASVGGVVSIVGPDPLFHAVASHGAQGPEPVRLARVGEVRASATDPRGGSSDDVAVVALAGHEVWIWTGSAFRAVDVRAF